jgi:acetyltransferase-like isoleucine patch superfamily enzyme
MAESTLNQTVIRHVAATFGRSETRIEPTWEREFAAALRSSHSRQELLDLFARFRTGESTLDNVLRRVLMLAVCKSAGKELQVEPNVTLKHPETFEFGDCVFIGAQAMIQGRFDGVCKIGSHVWIGPQAYFDARNLILEDYVGWGPGARVLGSVHTGMPVNEPIIRTDLVIKPVRVGYSADIGMNASLLPGVCVGAYSIIGAGAVVTHDIPDYAIAAGVPARVIRDRRKQLSGAGGPGAPHLDDGTSSREER